MLNLFRFIKAAPGYMIMTVIAKRLFMPFPLSLYSLLKLLILYIRGPQKCSPVMYHYLVKIIVKKLQLTAGEPVLAIQMKVLSPSGLTVAYLNPSQGL